jgi:hypothetical protein
MQPNRALDRTPKQLRLLFVRRSARSLGRSVMHNAIGIALADLVPTLCNPAERVRYVLRWLRHTVSPHTGVPIDYEHCT